jgi:predicted TPR repeat methyltransferase
MNPSAHQPTNAEHEAAKGASDAASARRPSLKQTKRAADPVRILRTRIAEKPNDYRLHMELGTLLGDLRRYEEAIGSFLAAWRLNPDLDEACNKIGCAYVERGHPGQAVEWFERARQISPTPVKLLPFFGSALVMVGRVQEAAEVYDEWAKAEPDNPLASHLALAALGSKTTTKASTAYVRGLFDNYAAGFDGSLAKLKYCGPQLVLNALQRVAQVPAGEWEILDVGCGTGLVGGCLRPFARQLVGVDVSPGMLDKARRRAVYDTLIEADLFDYLRNQSQRFDILTAADVLTYLGELDEFFRGAANALKPNGVAVVLAEALNASEAYRLNASGRFSHSAHYLCSVMENSGFTVAEIRQDAMRQELNRPVPTFVAVGLNAQSDSVLVGAGV